MEFELILVYVGGIRTRCNPTWDQTSELIGRRARVQARSFGGFAGIGESYVEDEGQSQPRILASYGYELGIAPPPGWFMDPFVFGEYPKSMRDLVKERLPKCTEEEKMMIKGSLDCLGMNYYVSSYAKNKPPSPNEGLRCATRRSSRNHKPKNSS
ncbi:hypothetical protein GBA52_027224 [Prunus armeniaca]|nr:hypothetical protein GBA52_027224 [Prunus armeniaca]